MTTMRRALKLGVMGLALGLLALASTACSSDSSSDERPVVVGGAAGGPTGGTGGSNATGAKGGSGGSLAGTGGKGSGGTPATAGGSGGYLTASPLVGRGRPVESSPEGGEVAFDGEWGFESIWRTGPGGWLTVDIGEGPSRLLFVWHTDSTPDYTISPVINFGAPTGYHLEVSASGEDGSWSSVAEVTGGADDTSYRSGAHSFDFSGQRYVRFTIDELVSDQGQLDAQINEIEIHDISAAAEDTWAVVGFGQSRSTYHGHRGLFPELVNAEHPEYYPALIDLAEIGGEARNLVDEIDGYLELNPEFHHWIVAYGMGDAQNNRTPDETDFKASMQAVIDKLQDAGKVVLIPRLEQVTNDNHTTVAEFNTVIDELVAENALPPAPDLYALFSEHPELLCSECEQGREGLDFSPEGEAAVNQLWADTIDYLYAP